MYLVYSILVGRIVEPLGCETNSSIQVIAFKIYRILLTASTPNTQQMSDLDLT